MSLHECMSYPEGQPAFQFYFKLVRMW